MHDRIAHICREWLLFMPIETHELNNKPICFGQLLQLRWHASVLAQLTGSHPRGDVVDDDDDDDYDDVEYKIKCE